MRHTTVIPTNPLAESLENLGAIEGTGFFEVKPFKDWVGTSTWKEKIFKFRLCNAGEIEDVASSVKETSEAAKEIRFKIEILSRAIYLVDGRQIISQEELDKYNQVNETDFKSMREWVVVYLRNLERIVLNRLNAVYEALEYKQIRQLQGVVQCAITGKNFSKKEIPEDSLFIKYALAEIITTEGIKQSPNYLEIFEIDATSNKVPLAADATVFAQEEQSKNLNIGGEDTFEERRHKMEEKDTKSFS